MPAPTPDCDPDLSMIEHASSDIRAILDNCLTDRELSWQHAAQLITTNGHDLDALCAVADELRRQQVGDIATYVINRNINFTNVCIKTCRFCAFSRDLRSEEGYFLNTDEIVRRAQEAHELGATEVCLQAGLAPDTDGRLYIDLCRAIKEALPDIHIHGLSPEEIKYGALRAKMSIRDYLQELAHAGLGSLPGTSAEILDDDVRARISPGRISTGQWIEVVTTAHALGLPTTATMMYGHVETPAHVARHLDLLRSLQAQSGGFSEFVPLSFIHTHSPLFAREPGVRAGASPDEVRAVHAVARLMLGASFRHIQASWVKEGMDMTQTLLACGADDVGGTLINESISTAAGAAHGQRATPSMLREVIRAAGRIPAQRNTRYQHVRVFHDRADDSTTRSSDPLDHLSGNDHDGDERFGSYQRLVHDSRYRFQWSGMGKGRDKTTRKASS